MSSVYNPEADLMAQIERLELEARDVRQKLERTQSDVDRPVLERQLRELEEEVDRLRARLP